MRDTGVAVGRRLNISAPSFLVVVSGGSGLVVIWGTAQSMDEAEDAREMLLCRSMGGRGGINRDIIK